MIPEALRDGEREPVGRLPLVHQIDVRRSRAAPASPSRIERDQPLDTHGETGRGGGLAADLREQAVVATAPQTVPCARAGR